MSRVMSVAIHSWAYDGLRVVLSNMQKMHNVLGGGVLEGPGGWGGGELRQTDLRDKGGNKGSFSPETQLDILFNRVYRKVSPVTPKGSTPGRGGGWGGDQGG